jgi:hypothetical protein
MTRPVAEADRRELARLGIRIERLEADLDSLDIEPPRFKPGTPYLAQWETAMAEQRRRVSRVIARLRRRERALLAAHDLPAADPRTEPPGAPGSLELRED